jgi:hypothetical protein
MHSACNRLWACALSAALIVSLKSPAAAAGAIATMAPTGVAMPGSAAGAVNLGALNATGASLQGSNVLSLSPSILGGLSIHGTPTVAEPAKLSVTAGPSAVAAPALAEPVKLPIAAAPAQAEAAQDDVQAPTLAQDLQAAAQDAPAAQTGAKVSAKSQLEKIAKAPPESLSKAFDGKPADAPAVDAGSDAALPSGGEKYGKLGRKPSFQDPRTLSLARYILPELPNAPAKVDFSDKVKTWGMMLNDKLGCCTISAAGHEIQQWTANAGTQQTPPDSSILSAYEAVSGYRPGQPDTDSGANMLDVLKYWRKNGIAGHKIGAFAALDPTNLDHIRTAVWLFGSAYLGIALPTSAQKQDVWDVPAGGATGDGKPGSWGGHAVEIAGFSPEGVFVVTWGAVKLMTWNFFKTYVEEAYAIISQDFLADGKTPNNGLDMATLKADLKAVTADRVPEQTQPSR